MREGAGALVLFQSKGNPKPWFRFPKRHWCHSPGSYHHPFAPTTPQSASLCPSYCFHLLFLSLSIGEKPVQPNTFPCLFLLTFAAQQLGRGHHHIPKQPDGFQPGHIKMLTNASVKSC